MFAGHTLEMHVRMYMCASASRSCGVQTGFSTDPNESDIRVPIALWNTCSYTISCWGELGHRGAALFVLLAPMTQECPLPPTQSEHAV